MCVEKREGQQDEMNYRSRKWKRKREKILKRDGYLCQYWKRFGKRQEATTVHHIWPAAQYPEYIWCDWNLISLSTDAHGRMHDTAGNLTEEGERLKRRTAPPGSEKEK